MERIVLTCKLFQLFFPPTKIVLYYNCERHCRNDNDDDTNGYGTQWTWSTTMVQVHLNLVSENMKNFRLKSSFILFALFR